MIYISHKNCPSTCNFIEIQKVVFNERNITIKCVIQNITQNSNVVNYSFILNNDKRKESTKFDERQITANIGKCRKSLITKRWKF